MARVHIRDFSQQPEVEWRIAMWFSWMWALCPQNFIFLEKQNIDSNLNQLCILTLSPSLSMYITLSYDNMHAVFSIHPLGVSVDSTAMYLTTNSYLTHPLSLSLMYITISYYDIHVHAVFSIYSLGVSVDSTVMYLTTTSCSEPIAFNPSPRTNLTRTSEMTTTFVCVTMTCLSVVSLR